MDSTHNAKTAEKFNLLIGTYTKTGKSEGIYVYEFDSNNGKACFKNKAMANDPSYLVVSRNNKFLYAVNELENAQGTVSAFSFDSQTGSLNLLNKRSSEGESPCYLSTDQSNKHLFVANYGGSLAVLPLLSDGSLQDAVQVIYDQDKGRHIHSGVLSGDERFLLVSDLGSDRIDIYHYDSSSTPPLKEPGKSSYRLRKGSGPRHLAFHPTGDFAYSIQELSGYITVFRFAEGELIAMQDIDALPENFTGKRWASDIHLSPDGKFLYASNRDDANNIAIFKIGETGLLEPVGRSSSMGKTPRGFAIDPTGNFLLAANQNSDTIVIFKRDKGTGLLSDTGERLNIGSPVCLIFTEI